MVVVAALREPVVVIACIRGSFTGTRGTLREHVVALRAPVAFIAHMVSFKLISAHAMTTTCVRDDYQAPRTHIKLPRGDVMTTTRSGNATTGARDEHQLLRAHVKLAQSHAITTACVRNDHQVRI